MLLGMARGMARTCHASCRGKGHGKGHGKRHGKRHGRTGGSRSSVAEGGQQQPGRPGCGGVRPKFVAGGQGDGAVGSSGDDRNETFAAKRAGPLGARSGWRGTSSGERCLSHGSPCQRAPCGESRVFHTALRANVKPDDDRLNKNEIPPEPRQSSCNLSVREQKLRP